MGYDLKNARNDVQAAFLQNPLLRLLAQPGGSLWDVRTSSRNTVLETRKTSP